MKRVAIVGASADRSKFGNKAVRGYQSQGSRVVPINPHETEIEGLRAYRSVLDVPHPIDLASIYVPPGEGVRVVEEVAQRAIREVWLNPGADGPDVLRRARDLGLARLPRRL